jgi:hypothetical protein
MTKPVRPFDTQLIEADIRFVFMGETHRPIEYQSGQAPPISETAIRQAKTGMGVRYVLAISLGAAVIALAASYALFGF